MMNSIKINNYKNALVEVDAVLDCLQDEEYIKIPTDIMNAIKTNKNEDYIFEYDEELNYADWNLMAETKALLYNIFKKYLATDEQKQYFIEKERLETIQLEREKAKEYDVDTLFKNKNEITSETNETSKALINYKEEKWYKKIFNFIKNLLKKN